jgi:hypothetical protein
MKMNKKLVRLIHWNRSESKRLSELIDQKKYMVNNLPISPAELKEQDKLPSVFIIDLSRIPSQGRDFGIFIRKNLSTRNIPIIYLEGDLEKVAKTKEILPDAYYSNWKNVNTAISKSLNKKIEKPVVPDSVFAGYEGVPLYKKLGIKPNSKVALINPPGNIRQILKEIPEGVSVKEKIDQADLIIWFVVSIKELNNKINKIKPKVGKNSIWIAYPKKSSGVKSDLSQTIVRNSGLSSGLVDYKVCSIDETWSGLKFSVRKVKKI